MRWPAQAGGRTALLWMVHLFQGNFGDSLILHQPVLEAVVERLPVTLSLAAVAFVITVPIVLGWACLPHTGATPGLIPQSWGSRCWGLVPNFWIAICPSFCSA